jgi:tetratricopeptide (TPR) repeat protein
MWWFFKKNKKPTPPFPQSEHKKQKSENPNLAALKDSGFRGNHSESPDKRFLIGWIDGDLDVGVIGSRKTGNGKFIVIENGEIILQGEAERPNACKIANNGNFVINDWLFSNGLNGKFYAYNKTGKEIVSHRFLANLKTNCISDDGRFTASDLANSNSKDSGLLAIFDLEKGTLIRRIYPEDNAGSLLSISSVDKTITLDYKDLGRFRYSFDGVFLDKGKLQQARIEKGSVFDLLEKVKNTKNINEDIVKEIMGLLNKALAKGFDEYSKTQKAQAYRCIGEIYEAIENISEAVKNYELALKIDPKIGIKRRLSLLKKQI